MQSKNRRRLIAVAGVAVAGWLFWKSQFPTCEFNYRLTIDVETPEGVKTGSAITRVSYSSDVGWPNPGRFPHDKVTGEATHVDLGGGNHLFVTLTANASGRDWKDGALNALRLPLEILSLERKIGDENGLCWQVNAVPQRSADFSPVRLPTVVTFKDLNDPKSVELVDPRDISKAFGPGYAITSARIATTPEPPTEQIENKLKWLDTFKGKAALDGKSYAGPNDPISSQLGYATFKSEGWPQ